MPYEMNEGGFIDPGLVQDTWDRNREYQEERRQYDLANRYWEAQKRQQDVEREAQLSKIADGVIPGMTPEVEYTPTGTHVTYRHAKPEPFNLDVNNTFVDPVTGKRVAIDTKSGQQYDLGNIQPDIRPARDLAPHYTTDKQGRQWQVFADGRPSKLVTDPEGNPLDVPAMEDPAVGFGRAIEKMNAANYWHSELTALDEFGELDMKRRNAAADELRRLYQQSPNLTGATSATMGTNQLSAVSGQRSAGTRQFASEAEASAAEARGEIKPGDRIVIGGVSGTWQ